MQESEWIKTRKKSKHNVLIRLFKYHIPNISNMGKYACVTEKFREGPHTCNIIDNNSNRRVPDIARNKTPKPLLPSCIPVI